MSNCAVQMRQEGGVIRFDMPSSVGLLDAVVRQCERTLKEISNNELSSVTVVLREMLKNAIVHGNRNEEQRRVQVSLECLNGREFWITGADEGSGFDYRSVNAGVPSDPRTIEKRGYILIGNISKALLFNDRGNSVTAWVAVDDWAHSNRREMARDE